MPTTTSQTITARDEENNIAVQIATGAPTASATGYARGAVYLRSDGGDGTSVYFNNGSKTSASWTPVPAAATATILAALSTLTATATELNTAADLDVNGGLVRVKKLAISSTPTGSEQDTTWDLPSKAVVLDAYVDVTTAEATGATKTLDVGTLSGESGGDADGFIDGVSVSTTGVKQISLVSGSVTRGVLLKETVTGSGSATHSSPRPYSVSANTARSVSYTAGSNDFNEFRGSIYIVYMEIG